VGIVSDTIHAYVAGDERRRDWCGVVACSRTRSVERCHMGVDTSSHAELFAGPWRASLVNISRIVACHVTEWKGVYCLSITDRPECVRWETDRRGTIRQSGRVRFVRNVRFNSPNWGPWSDRIRSGGP